MTDNIINKAISEWERLSQDPETRAIYLIDLFKVSHATKDFLSLGILLKQIRSAIFAQSPLVVWKQAVEGALTHPVISAPL